MEYMFWSIKTKLSALPLSRFQWDIHVCTLALYDCFFPKKTLLSSILLKEKTGKIASSMTG